MRWYARLSLGVTSAESMARDHFAGKQPYMRMHGAFADGAFIPEAPLVLPAASKVFVSGPVYSVVS